MTFLVYSDVCCFNRPFDDQRQERIRLESEAVLLILTRCQQDGRLLGSEVVDAEINQTPDLDRQAQLRALAAIAASVVYVDQPIEVRAANLVAEGFAVFDALHLSCAEAGQADVLLTTDDRFLRRAERLENMLQVKVVNPVRWLMEVTANAAE